MKYPITVALFALLVGCNAETNFTNTNDGGEYEEGNGGLEWYPAELEVRDLTQGITASTTLQLNSVGENNLHIDEVRVYDSGGGVFYMGDDEYEDKVLAPGTSLEVPITATMDEWVEVVEGSIRIMCNDPDYAPSVLIPIFAYPAEDWEGGGEDTGGGDDTGSD